MLAVAFLALTLAVALGWLNGPDHAVQQALAEAWQPSLRNVFRAIAELGGIELTALLAAGLAVYLLRNGYRSDAWAVLVAFVAVNVFEVFYKAQLYHPAPPASASH